MGNKLTKEQTCYINGNIPGNIKSKYECTRPEGLYQGRINGNIFKYSTGTYYWTCELERNTGMQNLLANAMVLDNTLIVYSTGFAAIAQETLRTKRQLEN